MYVDATVDPLCSALETTLCDSRRVAGLCQSRDGSTELAPRKDQYKRLRYELSDVYLLEIERKTARMSYQYGNHTRRDKVGPRAEE